MLASLLGFNVSYIILLKGLLPFIIEKISGKTAPHILFD
jgi:hypothetical protein